MDKKLTKGVGFQRGVYAFCRTFIGPFVNIILHITYKPCKVRSRTFLCLGNHTQNLDPALMVIGTLWSSAPGGTCASWPMPH